MINLKKCLMCLNCLKLRITKPFTLLTSLTSAFYHSEICSCPDEIFSYLKFHPDTVILPYSPSHLFFSFSPLLFISQSLPRPLSSSLFALCSSLFTFAFCLLPFAFSSPYSLPNPLYPVL